MRDAAPSGALCTTSVNPPYGVVVEQQQCVAFRDSLRDQRYSVRLR